MISECCGVEDRMMNEDLSFQDLGLCPECRDHCVFISEEEFGNEYAREQEENWRTDDGMDN